MENGDAVSPRKLNSGFGEEEKSPGDQVLEHEVPPSTEGTPKGPESPVSSGRLLGAPEAEAVLTLGPLHQAASGAVRLGREPWPGFWRSGFQFPSLT